MIYQEHKPSQALGKYVKCYYTLEHDDHLITEDYAFATGCIEVMFTLNGSAWYVKINDDYAQTSDVELWGQILKPLPFRASGRSQVFGIRFHPAAAAFLLNDDVSLYNNSVLDLSSVAGKAIRDLHGRLQDAKSLEQRITLVDDYLIKKLADRANVTSKIDLVRQVMTEVTKKDFFDNIENVAERYGITSRYLQKVFVQHTGLTPKLYIKINRFQNSLVLMGKKEMTLTSVAHTSGYFDQSHFIREFKSFTGLSPSAFAPDNSTAILASPNK